MNHESRGAPRAWAVLVIASSFLAAVPGRPAEEAGSPCGDCDGTRKARCATCDGRGEIHRVCATCKGTGKKPCTVCAEGEAGSSVTAGRIPCSLCKGRGTRESTGKACSRCRGKGSASCSSCLGKGTLRCARETYERICPDCRFTGKVECPSCSGDGEPRTGGDADLSNAGLDEAASIPLPSDAGRSKLPPELQARHRKLTALHDKHMEIFAVDASRKAEGWKMETARLERRLEEGGQTAESFEKFQSRVTHFRLRYGELRDVFLEAYRAYKVVASIWKSRDRAIEAAPPARRDEVAKEQDERLEVVLRIAEAKAAKLEEEQPTWLLKEIEDLGAMHAELKSTGETSLAHLEKERAREEESRRIAREAERQRRAAEKRALASTPRARKPETLAVDPEIEEETQDPIESHIARARARKDDESEEDSSAVLEEGSSGAVLAALACAAGGFAAGAAVILLRKGKRAGEPAPAAAEPAAGR